MSTEPTGTEQATPSEEMEKKVAEQNEAAKDAADEAAAEAKEAEPVLAAVKEEPAEEVKAEDPPTT